MERVYIAGPISNDPDYQEKFRSLAEELWSRKFHPVNPADIGGGDHSYKWYIDRGLGLLQECTIICLLPGWRESTGASLEYTYSRAVGMPAMKAEQGPDGRWQLEWYLSRD